MSKTTWVIVALIGLLIALGVVGHFDRETELLERASNNCQRQNAYTIPTFQQCLNNQLEK